jgi:glyoxylase-like metal-dependent hydrolase (beta-lactamase superfamily II)
LNEIAVEQFLRCLVENADPSGVAQDQQADTVREEGRDLLLRDLRGHSRGHQGVACRLHRVPQAAVQRFVQVRRQAARLLPRYQP